MKLFFVGLGSAVVAGFAGLVVGFMLGEEVGRVEGELGVDLNNADKETRKKVNRTAAERIWN